MQKHWKVVYNDIRLIAQCSAAGLFKKKATTSILTLTYHMPNSAIYKIIIYKIVIFVQFMLPNNLISFVGKHIWELLSNSNTISTNKELKTIRS